MFKLISLFLLALSLPAFAADEAPAKDSPSAALAESAEPFKTITRRRYIASGILSVAPGLGHAIQGRWRERGWIFTAGSAALIPGLMLWEKIVKADLLSFGDSESAGIAMIAGNMIIIMAWKAVYVWGIADTWNLPPHYKIADGGLRLQPFVFHSGTGGLLAGAALSYKF